nr:zinc finger, CCHC-type [Tanacetum cinerariifolium]GEZ38214.1 zinc finger, CCHC-type [Tanacetum cinerariifolium]
MMRWIPSWANTWVLADLPPSCKPLGCKMDLQKKDEGRPEKDILVTKSHYIEKVLKNLNYFDYTQINTLMDTSKKLIPNTSKAVSQLEYSKVIGCLMYFMTCTRPAIAFTVDRLSSLSYTGHPSVLNGYTDAS